MPDTRKHTSPNIIPFHAVLEHAGLAQLCADALGQVQEAADALAIGNITGEEYRAVVTRWTATLREARL